VEGANPMALWPSVFFAGSEWTRSIIHRFEISRWIIMRRLVGGITGTVFMLAVAQVPAWSWSLQGHRAIGMIADLILQDSPAGAIAEQLLDGAGLSEASTWADCAKGACRRALTMDERIYVHNNPQHRIYHYTDVPMQQFQYKLGMAGTRTDDAVQITKHAVNVLRGRAASRGPAVLDRKSALWVLAHLVGDLHQPLHVGALYYDETCTELVDPNIVGPGQPNFGIGSTVVSADGGNALRLPNGKSFHVAYWDDGTVTGAIRLAGVRKRSIQDFATYVVAHPSAARQTVGDPETWPEQWASEIMPLAKAALTLMQIGDPVEAAPGSPKCSWPVALSREYTSWANHEALAQLSKAGFRLAALVRTVFGP
jgi:hypothetical protein